MKRLMALALMMIALLAGLSSTWAERNAEGPEQAVLAYLETLKKGDIEGAKQLLADPETLAAWTLGKRMEILGFPSLKQADILGVEKTPAGAQVHVRCQSLDMTQVFLNIDEYGYYFDMAPYYNPGFEDWLEETLQDEEAYQALWSQAERYEKSEDITYHCVQQGEGWFIDLAGSVAGWRQEAQPFDLRAASWGHARTHDVNQNNIWLRLDSKEPRAALETLVDFRVAAGDARCDSLPVPLASSGFDGTAWMTLHFMPKEGFSRGALEMNLADGADINQVVIACTRRVNDLAFNYYEDEIALPLKGLAEDAGYPQGGARFQAHSLTPFQWDEEKAKRFMGDRGHLPTLQEVLSWEAYGMPDVPESVLALPYHHEDYRFYALAGEITKKPGSFGVYDVVFALSGQPEGVYASSYKACSLCDEIDDFDMFGNDVIRPNGLSDVQDDYYRQMGENLKSPFHVLLLVNTAGRSEEEILQLVESLDITAAFSGEKWNMSYEQHGITTGIGPSSSEKVHMEGLVWGEGPLRQLD